MTVQTKLESWTLPHTVSEICANLFPVFIETGTFQGGGIQQALAAGFKKVISFEVAINRYVSAEERFRDDGRVTIIHGDSAEMLGGIIESNPSAFIFLDAHSPGGTSLLAELKTILETKRPYGVAVDDMQMIKSNRGWGSTIGFDDVTSLLQQISVTGEILYIDNKLKGKREIALANIPQNADLGYEFAGT